MEGSNPCGSRTRHLQDCALVGAGLNGDCDMFQAAWTDRTDPNNLLIESSGIIACTGCVDGHTGSLILSVSIKGTVVTNADGTRVVMFAGPWEVIKGTGDLEGATGRGIMFDQTVERATFLTGKIFVPSR